MHPSLQDILKAQRETLAMAPKIRKNSVCFLCPEDRPNRAVDAHHVFPVEYGGDMEGHTIDLCPGCHDKLHRLAVQVFKGVLDLDTVGNPKWNAAIRAIVESRRKFESGEVQAVDARRRISVSFSEDELKRMHFAKTDRGFNSAEKFIKWLVEREYTQIAKGN